MNTRPSELFERRSRYNLPVWMSRHPDLNAYIRHNSVTKFHIVLVREEDEEVTERYTMELEARCTAAKPSDRPVRNAKQRENVASTGDGSGSVWTRLEREAFAPLIGDFAALLVRIASLKDVLDPLPRIGKSDSEFGYTFQCFVETRDSGIPDGAWIPAPSIMARKIIGKKGLETEISSILDIQPHDLAMEEAERDELCDVQEDLTAMTLPKVIPIKSIAHSSLKLQAFVVRNKPLDLIVRSQDEIDEILTKHNNYAPEFMTTTAASESATKSTGQQVVGKGGEAERIRLKLWKGDITRLPHHVTAIVNAANSTLLGGGGVDGAIHRAAGASLKAACRKLNGCLPGEAKITPSFKLDKACDWIIHSVGPIYPDLENEEDEEEDSRAPKRVKIRQDIAPHARIATAMETLASCYTTCMDHLFQLTPNSSRRSIVFPCISTGVYGYPNGDAAGVALDAVVAWIQKNYSKRAGESSLTQDDELKDIRQLDVIFCLFLDVDVAVYETQFVKHVKLVPEWTWDSDHSTFI